MSRLVEGNGVSDMALIFSSWGDINPCPNM